ncbi:MAG: peptidoglycan DD-metalloendopeptidase family protein [Archangiaceae bacterium]|nr:peptidoglycan DD-metalloendopeptidase family protein [Archangiaceae bacterium]
MSGALLVALLLAAGPQELREEQEDVAERLETERAALTALQSSKVEVLAVVDLLERAARASSARAAELQKSAADLQVRAALARAEAEATRADLSARQAKLGPRVSTLYRLLKEDRLSRLISAQTFGALVRKERALGTLVKADLKQLEQLAVLSAYEQRQASRLELLEDSAQAVLTALTREQAMARGRRVALDDLIRTLNAEASRSSRVVKDLEKAEAELGALVQELKATQSETGLRSRKGHLPFPTRGSVEVGFGKVVNPRFNTVTVQKGVDIRAGEGQPVLSVGPGTVAFAGWLKGYGNLVIVDHGAGYHSLYAHLKDAAVEVGVVVEEGEEIATVGDTGSLKGSYLYFEIRKQGQAIDPLPWLEAQE